MDKKTLHTLSKDSLDIIAKAIEEIDGVELEHFLNKVLDVRKRKKRIYIAALGRSFLVMKAFAMRLMQLADKADVPIITLIDTPGAFPGISSEERHIAEAIAVNLRDMFALRVPVISVIIGEGGSGGAIGIGVGNRVLIMENAYYSVITPEGCAAILWKDRKFAPQAADALQLPA